MSRPNNRRRLTPVVRNVANLLRSEWDPIGHSRMTQLPSDEYDSYAPHLVSMITMGASDAAIAEHLHKLEVEAIGVESAADRRAIARQLRQIVSDTVE